jgi:hypothetical protein
MNVMCILHPQQLKGVIFSCIAVGVNVNAMSANWSIKNTSQCINAGIPDLSGLNIPDYDLNGNTKVRNGRIAALRPEPCYPTGSSGRKADSGPYSHSMSNIEDNRFQTGISEYLINSEGLIITPNPFKESTTLLFNNPEGYQYKLYIIDLSGKVCRIVNSITTSDFVLEKGDLKQVFYFIELRGPKIFRGKLVTE